MPPTKKRKTRATKMTEEDVVVDMKTTESEPELHPAKEDSKQMPDDTEVDTATETTESSSTPSASLSAADKAKERLERFKALQARAKLSSESNLKEARIESQRLATDPNALNSLHRKSAIASHNLLKADTEAAGEDFERKRAWDWTIEESERWDKRLKKKAAHRDDQAFQDYRQDSRKVYKRQIRSLKPDMDHYEQEKMKAIEKAAASGGLEIVETDDGELVAVDKNGTFYSSAESTGFVENKPDKAAVDRLVKDLQQAQETRLRKRRERMGANGDDGDVTYINEKNKQFNQKLSRFYNKYTAEIRDSFERGTMI